MNRFTRLIVAAAISAMPLAEAGSASVPEMRAPTTLEPWDGNAEGFWPKSEYPELYRSTIRLRGFWVPSAAHSDFAIALEEHSGGYILIAIERSVEAQTFRERITAAKTENPKDAARAEAESRPSGRKPQAMSVRRCAIGLHHSLAEKLIEIWTRMLRDIRTMESNWVVVDGGTDYFWMDHNGESLAGRTFAPSDDTNPGALSAILAAMPDYCQSGTANLHAIQTKTNADRNKIETFADHLLAKLRGTTAP